MHLCAGDLVDQMCIRDRPDIRSPDLWGPAEHPYDDRMRAGDSRYFAGIPGG